MNDIFTSIQALHSQQDTFALSTRFIYRTKHCTSGSWRINTDWSYINTSREKL